MWVHYRRSAFISFLGVLGASLVLMAGCERKIQGAAGPPPSKNATPEVAVVVLQPERVAITTELPGRTSAYLVAEVRPQVSGIVQARLFTEGSNVEAGDVLYQIDPALHRASYDTAVAALSKAEASLRLNELRTKRNKTLIDTGAISQEEYDNALASLQQARADVAYSSATIASARVNMGFTQITAPISGRIGRSNVTMGALATAHQGPAFATIQQIDPIYVDVTQSSANLLRLRRNLANGRIKIGPDGARVKLILEDGTPYPLEGTLKFSDVTVDPSTGSFILRIIFPNPDQILLPGMYVRAVIEVGVNEQAIVVPQRAVSRNPKGEATALVVDSSDKVEQRRLQVERAVGDKWLVGEGLKPGDRVIMEGLQMARPGSAVKVVPFNTETQTTSSAGVGRSTAAGK